MLVLLPATVVDRFSLVGLNLKSVRRSSVFRNFDRELERTLRLEVVGRQRKRERELLFDS